MTTRIVVAGCGAVGSQLTLMIAQPDIVFVLIDDDRIEQDNIATSAFSRQHIGAFKATVLGELLYRKAGCVSEVYNEELTPRNARRLLYPHDILLDCFDNVDARQLTCHPVIPSPLTLHVGVSRERTGAVTWDDDYQLPRGTQRGEEQFCTHMAGRRIIRFTAAVAANMVDEWLATGRQSPSVLTTEERIIYVR